MGALVHFNHGTEMERNFTLYYLGNFTFIPKLRVKALGPDEKYSLHLRIFQRRNVFSFTKTALQD